MAVGDRKLDLDELAEKARVNASRSSLPAITLVLDRVRSGHNVGSIFRSADAFGVRKVILCGFTPGPPDREVLKTALGATSSIPWERHANTLSTVKQLQVSGHRVLAVEQTAEAVPLVGMDHSGSPLALVFGNELNGVDPAVVEACDAAVHLPQVGSKHSLNVAVCAGAALWELVRERLI